MADYFIQVTNIEVLASRIINGKVEPIRFNGERALPLDKFWQSFKDKIEYEVGDAEAFIIVSDNDEFTIDSMIGIAEQFDNNVKDLSVILEEYYSTNQHVYLYPDIDIAISQTQTEVTANVDQSKCYIPDDANPNSIQMFYWKKTEKYKAGK